jgi:glutamyl-tRNA reductase
VHICLAGLSHKTAPIDVRERVAIAPADYPRALSEISRLPALRELVVVSTCNRTELYCVADAYHGGVRALDEAFGEMGRRAGLELDGFLYRRHGAAAVRHLFRVASSLDSLVVGEPQILGQVKDAYREAADSSLTGVALDRLFAHAFEVGKRVRTETEIGTYAVSVSSAAVELAKKIFGSLSGRRALVIGAGEMAELTLRHLHDSGVERITVANRTRETAQALAREFGAAVVGLDELGPALAPADIVVASAASPDYLLRRPQVETAMRERRNRPVFVIDIAVPRNVEPAVGQVYNVFLYSVDDLEKVVEDNRERRTREAERAEQIVEQEVERFLKWWVGLEAVPTIVALREKIEKLSLDESRRLLARLQHLPERDRKLVEQFGPQLVHKILHLPTAQIRNVGDAERCALLAASLRYLFRLDEGEGSAAGHGAGAHDAAPAGPAAAGDPGSEPAP